MVGKRTGIDLRKLDTLIRNASVMSSGCANMTTEAFKKEFETTFALDLAHKDQRSALELADDLGVPGLIAPQVRNRMRMARNIGLGGGASCSIIRVYEAALNEEVRV